MTRAAAARSFAARLLAWFDAGHRDLPWRRTSDPWAIWVSEIMLQQTRVEAVRAAYERFVERFPTPASFAASDDDALQSAWRGLGYYRRARLLRDGARHVVAEHGGRVPADPDAIGRLPGVGPYTRGALASIAFAVPLTAVDGNVERVAARHRGIDGDVKRGDAARRVRETAEAWLDRARPGDFNQALMELGAVVCTPRSPRCSACPVGDDCEARSSGRQDQLPAARPRKAFVDVTARAVLVPRRDGVLGLRVGEGAVNAGQLDLPGPGLLTNCADTDALVGHLRGAHGVDVELDGREVSVRHGITTHRIVLTAHLARCDVPNSDAFVVADPADERAPWSTAARKVFRRVSAEPSLSSALFAKDRR